jgi:hypothetical protein
MLVINTRDSYFSGLAALASAAAAAAASTSDTTGKKKKKKKDKKAGETVATATAPAATPSSSAAPSSTSAGPSGQPKDSAKPSFASMSAPSAASVVAAVAATPPAPSADVVAEVTSRDEMVAHLLAMGFDEADCLAAITACGLDVDKAISWICDRPSPTQEALSKAGAGESKDAGKKASSAAVASKNSSAAAAAAADAEAALKAQKDKEHKEELRRINRAWNARVPQQRAEEERKKVCANNYLVTILVGCCVNVSVLCVDWVCIEQQEAERVQKEMERQKVIQQQLQQQYSMHSMFNPGMQGGYGAHGMYGIHGAAPGMMMQGGMQGPMQQVRISVVFLSCFFLCTMR